MSNIAIRVTKLKIPLVGEEVPKQANGNVGRLIEFKLKQAGYNVNSRQGLDLPDENLEIKSRKEESTSAHTIGEMLIENIISTPWDQTLLKEKCQRQYRVSYSDDYSVIKEAEIYDFTTEYLQDKFREAYEEGRKLISKGKRSGYIRGSRWGYFEMHRENSYQFRIPHSAMKDVITASTNNFDSLFESV
jgi:hypothetical protein